MTSLQTCYQLVIATYKGHGHFLISITLTLGWVVFTQHLLGKMCVLCKSFFFSEILLNPFTMSISSTLDVTCTIHIILPCALTAIIAWIKCIIVMRIFHLKTGYGKNVNITWQWNDSHLKTQNVMAGNIYCFTVLHTPKTYNSFKSNRHYLK